MSIFEALANVRCLIFYYFVFKDGRFYCKNYMFYEFFSESY